uniref:Uncharacterized protein n=1 Tax=Megaselia scalaris TaxID=36166 RepID=T1GPS1_MEGSC
MPGRGTDQNLAHLKNQIGGGLDVTMNCTSYTNIQTMGRSCGKNVAKFTSEKSTSINKQVTENEDATVPDG